MILFYLSLLPVLVVLVLELRNYRRKKIVNKNFPGPQGLPVIGNAHEVGKTPSEILDQMFYWWNDFGKKNFRVWIGYFPNIIVSEPKTIEYILNSNTLLQKSDVYDLLHPWLGEGLLTSFGSKWHKHRKMITPSFHFKILQEFHEVMNENSTKFIESLRQKSAGETVFDFQDCAHYLTLDVICETAMGVPINAMAQHDSAIVKAFKEMCYNINMRAFHPIKRNNALYRLFPDYKDYQKTLKVLQDFTYDVIKQRMEARREDASNAEAKQSQGDGFAKRKMAFLDTLLTSTIDNRPLTLQEIYEEVSTFMFEGHDTTTSGVTFAVYLLSRHPRIQAKVYEEQKAVMGSNMKGVATFQEISEMKYLDIFIKEAQRLYPSVPIIGRQTDKDYEINGQIFPKGTSLNLFLMSLGYNEAIFKDPFVVRPERFETEKPGPFEYVPFSAGQRNCIGQKFALLEIKTVVSKIVREFEVLPPLDELVAKQGEVQNFMGLSREEQREKTRHRHKYDPILSAVLTLKSENGIMLRMRPRK